jgi:8-oxo-dGTP pyrophosphatase MutT (NUDIX family)
MKILVFNDRKDYEPLLPRLVRYSANSIIITDKKIGMIYVEKHKFYAFPGGGIEENETIIDALIRKTEEEAGLIIKPSTITEFGKLVEIRKDRHAEGIYERHDHYYLCDVEDKSVAPRLSKSEIEYGHEFVFISVDKAISINEINMRQGFNWTEGITHILKLLKDKQNGYPIE